VIRRLYEDYFDLQLRFAARYAAVAALPFHEAVDRCTNLRRRFGLWGPPGDARWAEFLDQLQGRAQSGALRTAMLFHDAAAAPDASPFGCFSFDPRDAQGDLRLHFMPQAQHRRTRPLAAASLPERRAELRAMFAELRRSHPQVRRVRGLSWLYHVGAYRNLFPPAYAASVTLPLERLHMNGSSTWGQVLDHQHRVRPGVGQAVLAGLGPTTVHVPWRAFPLQPLAAACPAEDFFDWFA
jgi:hypothetical protein